MPGTAARYTNYASENVTAIKNFAEYVAPDEISSCDELALGKGAIVREGLHKVAAYRDTNGKLHKCSAMCTHLGCHVHWNSLERAGTTLATARSSTSTAPRSTHRPIAPLEKLD